LKKVGDFFAGEPVLIGRGGDWKRRLGRGGGKRREEAVPGT